MKGGMEVAGVYMTLLPWGVSCSNFVWQRGQQLEGLCGAVRSTLDFDVQTLLLTRWVTLGKSLPLSGLSSLICEMKGMVSVMSLDLST